MRSVKRLPRGKRRLLVSVNERSFRPCKMRPVAGRESSDWNGCIREPRVTTDHLRMQKRIY